MLFRDTAQGLKLLFWLHPFKLLFRQMCKNASSVNVLFYGLMNETQYAEMSPSRHINHQEYSTSH